MADHPDAETHRCADRQTRRGFLHAACCVAGALTATRMFGGDPAAIPISAATGEQIGNERSYPIPPADGASVDHEAQVILARVQGKVFAFALSCPHQNAAVKWLAMDRRFQCTKHDSQYQPDGTYTSGRATRNMDRFPIRRQATNVIVDVTQVYQSDRDPVGWSSACVTL